jgi:hypothetical protein
MECVNYEEIHLMEKKKLVIHFWILMQILVISTL